MNAIISTVAMDAMNRGWQLGFGTMLPRRRTRPVNRRGR
jgi:hypothetical protein